MTPERWSQIQVVYERAETLAADDRAAYLDKVCANDADLRTEVESLLGYGSRVASQFLNTPAANLVSPDVPEEGYSNWVGHRIGIYQILAEIGHGGMGEVYRAARADGQYDQQVAIKFVRSGMNISFILQRFRNERQILASLEHPNIARLLDGGTTEDGIPFLVMELIEGIRVDEYCQQHKLSISDRLCLFLQVCGAVQYAHQRLVIHRDLKPNNILVTEEGLPKLLDFGIAKILDSDANEETTLARPMTPEYASPEQVRGDAITTATDVYSLGVVLHQLLTARSPYRVNANSPHELSREIAETEPAKPSSLALKPAQLAATDSSAHQRVISVREESPQKLQRRLSGDLDDIILMALRKEPERRYSSVQQFAEDITRHLDGLPVIARKNSWRYVARKFLKRHKAPVAATIAVVLALLAGIFATARQARIAREERARAEKRFDDVREFSNSLIFDVHDALQNLPGATPVRKLLLDRAVQYLDRVASDSADNPDLQRELAWGYQRLAVVQGNGTESNMGDQSGSLASDRKALALFEQVAAKNTTNVIDQLNVAMMHRIISFSSITEASGLQELAKATTITDRLLREGSTDPRVRSERSIEYQNKGLSQDAAGDRAGALGSLQEYQRMRLDILTNNPDYHGALGSAATASIMVGYAQARRGMRAKGLKSIDQGITYYQQALKVSPNPLLQRYLAVAETKRGDIRWMDGDYQAALADYVKAETILKPLADADPEDDLIQGDRIRIDYLKARLLIGSHQYKQALPLLQKAATGNQKYLSKDATNPDPVRESADILISLGEAYAGSGNLAEALRAFQQASTVLAPRENDPLEDDFNCELATALVKTGDTLLAMGNPVAAKKAYRQALDIAIPRATPNYKNVPALYPIANAYLGAGDASLTLARGESSQQEKQKHLAEACASFQDSKAAWSHVPDPSPISPNGFLSRSPKQLESRLANCPASIQ